MTARHATDIRHLEQVDRRQLPADGGEDFNRLIFTASPYLLQHAENPIDWYPWGDEAFTRARAEDKPLLLSIGYSTCHWCHVMAHESFEDAEVAALINRDYIAVKVDREERPDVDHAYMEICQMMTGGGGWPLTLLLAPDKRPFFAATYLPKRSRNGMSGLLDILAKAQELWRDDRDRLLQTCRQVDDALQQAAGASEAPQPINSALLESAAAQYRQSYDALHAGFGDAPKFPAPHNLSLLLRLGRRLASDELTQMALLTLQAIRRGGIYDQLGYGLHRYSVDRYWLVPHFEKMLYDQALYILACCDAAQATGDSVYTLIARQTASYLLRDLQHSEGGFFAGEDADSEGAEGTFYLWSPEQVAAELPEPGARRFTQRFHLKQAGNFEGASILYLAGHDPIDDPQGETDRMQLLNARARRPRPHRDEKLLSGWNGLAIAALARLAGLTEDPEILAAAERAADLVAGRMVRDGRLLRRLHRGEAGIPGFLEDYANYTWGLLELYQAGCAPHRLLAALHWCEQLTLLFDAGDGGMFDSAADSEPILNRGRSLQDGAMPTGSAVAANVLLRLGRLCGRQDLYERGVTLLERHAATLERYPSAYAQSLIACDFALGPVGEVTIAVGNNRSEAERMREVVRAEWRLQLQLIWKEPGETRLDEQIERQRPQLPVDGLSAAYLCLGNSCREPVTDARDLQGLLAELTPRRRPPADR